MAGKNEVNKVIRFIQYISDMSVLYLYHPYREAIPKKLHRNIMLIRPTILNDARILYEGFGDVKPSVQQIIVITPQRAKILIPFLREIVENKAYENLKAHLETMMRLKAKEIVDSLEDDD